MGYTAHELSRISGVSVRTLHHYEDLGLLSPARRANGYRDYGPHDVRRLQRILLWRQTGLSLARIRELLDAHEEVVTAALNEQLRNLRTQRGELDALIATVERMARESAQLAGQASHGSTSQRIATPIPEGNPAMAKNTNDRQRFEALKQQAVAENERAYGAEARARYGDAQVDACNEQLMGLSAEQWSDAEALQGEIGRLLALAASDGAPSELVQGEIGRALCGAHRAWLQHYWAAGMYSPQAHRGLAQMYVADERFASYYEKMAPNGAAILRDAIDAWVDRI